MHFPPHIWKKNIFSQIYSALYYYTGQTHIFIVFDCLFYFIFIDMTNAVSRRMFLENTININITLFFIYLLLMLFSVLLKCSLKLKNP